MGFFWFVCLGFFKARASYLSVVLLECVSLPFMYVFLGVLKSLSGRNFVESRLSTVQHKVPSKV